MPDHESRATSKAPFMCECGASLCDTRVPTSATEYEADVGPLLAEGHGPVDAGLERCSVCGRPRRSERRDRR
jgi:hypothetical protein